MNNILQKLIETENYKQFYQKYNIFRYDTSQADRETSKLWQQQNKNNHNLFQEQFEQDLKQLISDYCIQNAINKEQACQIKLNLPNLNTELSNDWKNRLPIILTASKEQDIIYELMHKNNSIAPYAPVIINNNHDESCDDDLEIESIELQDTGSPIIHILNAYKISLDNKTSADIPLPNNINDLITQHTETLDNSINIETTLSIKDYLFLETMKYITQNTNQNTFWFNITMEFPIQSFEMLDNNENTVKQYFIDNKTNITLTANQFKIQNVEKLAEITEENQLQTWISYTEKYAYGGLELNAEYNNWDKLHLLIEQYNPLNLEDEYHNNQSFETIEQKKKHLIPK